MDTEKSNIDIDRLQRDLEMNSMGAFFGGGFGGALVEASDIKHVSESELIEIAKRQGIDLEDYGC